MKSTRGPWRYDTKECCVHSPDRTIIHEHQEPDNPVAVADAFLIASAPDLYAALESLYKANDRGGNAFGLGDALIAADAALAKARGGS